MNKMKLIPDDYLKLNKTAWDKRTAIHVDSKFYDVAGFLNGNSSLQEIELKELSELQNKKLLHLQCHFGLDTLSLARLGANVTGIDISSVAINEANILKEKAGLNANFICDDIYNFGLSVKPDYDIVFASYGTVCWLPDLSKWANTIANSLKYDGIFYFVEFHPLYDLLEGYSYFAQVLPDIEASGTYTENCDGKEYEMAVWPHPISEVINSLFNAGLTIESFNEFDFSPYECFPDLVEKKSGRFYLEKKGQNVPLVYSLQARKLK